MSNVVLIGKDHHRSSLSWTHYVGELRRDWMDCLRALGWAAVSSAEVSCRARELVDAISGCDKIKRVDVGYPFLSRLTRADQTDFLRIVGSLYSVQDVRIGHAKQEEEEQGASSNRGNVILWSPLFQGLVCSPGRLEHLELSHVELRSRKEIRQLASCIERSGDSLRTVILNDLSCSVSCSTNSTTSGLLDPILVAVSKTRDCRWLHLNGDRTRCGPRLLGTKALRLLLRRSKLTRLRLSGAFMRVDDEHCHVIATTLAERPQQLAFVNLRDCPNVSEHGYHALLRLVNKNPLLTELDVDEKIHQTNFDSIIRMNRHGRYRYLAADGSFRSQSKWVEWLATMSREMAGKDALSGIYHSIREVPHYLSIV